MEQQGAAARYANCGDDENSQAEGSSDGAIGFTSRSIVDNTNAMQNVANNNAPNPHYENIYESIDQYAAAAAAPADNNNIVVPPTNNAGISVQRSISQQNGSNAAAGGGAAGACGGPSTSNNRSHAAAAAAAVASSLSYRNELYDRTAGYDVPRQSMRNANFPTNNSTSKRRANLHLDLNPNRPRYTTASRPHRQRSFDDTESYYNNYRCENIYEQIHEEPIYRNVSSTGSNGSRVYGRLGVIGHGIGRIERHLSSSCGNIDHFNLGGHYAVLGHSHLGTVGHIRLNAAAAPNSTKDSTTAKTLNFFSCLGRENSQSMTNIHRAATSTNGGSNATTATNGASTTTTSNASSSGGASTSASAFGATAPTRPTGTVPKSKAKSSSQKTYDTAANAHGHADNTLNRISKSSLQWLLVNKWLPLWMGQGPDYNILDFNFMFSRNCDGCYDSIDRQQGVVRFNGHAEMRPRTEPPTRAYSNVMSAAGPCTGSGAIGGSMRPMRMNHSLNRLREYDRNGGSLLSRDNSLDERSRFARDGNVIGTHDRNRFRDAMFDRSMRIRTESEGRSSSLSDPFRNWELNTENNSFRPAGSGMTRDIRRITDGTYPSAAGNLTGQHLQLSSSAKSSPMRRLPTVKSEPTSSVAVASTSSAAISVTAIATVAGAAERVTTPKLVAASVLDSRTESGNDSPSPDLGRRYSDDTEDDQHTGDQNENETDNDDDGANNRPTNERENDV